MYLYRCFLKNRERCVSLVTQLTQRVMCIMRRDPRQPGRCNETGQRVAALSIVRSRAAPEAAADWWLVGCDAGDTICVRVCWRFGGTVACLPRCKLVGTEYSEDKSFYWTTKPHCVTDRSVAELPTPPVRVAPSPPPVQHSPQTTCMVCSVHCAWCALCTVQCALCSMQCAPDL